MRGCDIPHSRMPTVFSFVTHYLQKSTHLHHEDLRHLPRPSHGIPPPHWSCWRPRRTTVQSSTKPGTVPIHDAPHGQHVGAVGYSSTVGWTEEMVDFQIWLKSFWLLSQLLMKNLKLKWIVYETGVKYMKNKKWKVEVVRFVNQSINQIMKHCFF